MSEKEIIEKEPFFTYISGGIEYQIVIVDDNDNRFVYGRIIDSEDHTTYSHPTRWVSHFVNQAFNCSTSLNDDVSFSIGEDENGTVLFFEGTFGTLEIHGKHSKNTLTYTSKDPEYIT